MVAAAVQLNNWFLLLFTGLLLVSSSYAIHYIEPETFESSWKGFWWVMTTVTTVGYGDYSPVTKAGQGVAIFLYIVGIGLIGVVIGKVVDAFGSYKRKKEEGRLKFRGSDHYVVIGWSEKAKDAMKELMSSNHDAEIVLIDMLEKSPMSGVRYHYIQGEPTDEEVLTQANIADSKAIMVFSPPQVEDPVLADGRTLLIATAIEHYGVQHGVDVYTVVEVMKENHVNNFRHAKVDDFILSNQMTSNLMAKASQFQGSSRLFQQLLRTQHGDDLYLFPKHPKWETYQHAHDFFLSQGANLVADREDFGVIRRMHEPLPAEAQLFIICDYKTYKQTEENYQSL
ncbi:TrkA family potassium uptake protein [Mechercharimyces sp. CAU 1602]|uniref:potassium channel family protein n=1 Tax=Mechercharimyces sp. CAU 1602 TaxID=2973933 RepID=UPI0021628EF7|nr:potassium channel family protein [Mechercharimyces sp. CAU 1602]MCS1349998.1 ion channel [Mechercharimyces sp. CAU 1602]